MKPPFAESSTMTLGDAVLSGAARRFLNSLPRDQRIHCIEALLSHLSTGQDGPANSKGQFNKLFRGWHFRYKRLNAVYAGIDTIYYSPNNPAHPMNKE